MSDSTQCDPLIDALEAAIGKAYVLTDEHEVAPFLSDWRGRYSGKARCVVRPANTEEVAAVVRCCADAGVPMVPQAGNTGLCGGATPDVSGEAVVISVARLNQIIEVDAANNTLTVGAGCLLADVQAAAARVGKLFPLSLASEGSCRIGGNVSTNAGGVHVLRYGNMRDLTLGLEVVLPDGRIWNGLQGLRKDNTGYDLRQLFVGAEGTLGVVTGVVVKLFPQQNHYAAAWIAVPDAQSAVTLLGVLHQSAGDRITAFELVSDVSLKLVLQHIPGTRTPLESAAPWYVLAELSDTAAGDLDERLQTALEAAVEAGLVNDAAIAQDESQRATLWKLRESISEAQKKDGYSIKHDIAVPVSRIPEFLSAAGEALAKQFPSARIVAFGHVGDGNLHYNLSIAGDEHANQTLLQQTPNINRIVHDLVVSMGGSLSAEHGIGQLKRGELAYYKSDVEIALMRTIKQALDPRNLMNPGKVL